MAPVNPDPNEVQNAISELLPLKARKKLYALFILLGVVIAVIYAAFAVTQNTPPMWLVIVTAVYGVLQGFQSLIARSNVGAAGLN